VAGFYGQFLAAVPKLSLHGCRDVFFVFCVQRDVSRSNDYVDGRRKIIASRTENHDCEIWGCSDDLLRFLRNFLQLFFGGDVPAVRTGETESLGALELLGLYGQVHTKPSWQQK
jgi:hypothetical protein